MLLRRKKKKEKKKALEAAAAQLAVQYDPSDPRSPMYQRPHSAITAYSTENQLSDFLEDSGSDDFLMGDVNEEYPYSEGPADNSPTQPLPQRPIPRSQTNPEHIFKKILSQPAMTLPSIPSESQSIQCLPTYQGPQPPMTAPVLVQTPVQQQPPPVVMQPTPAAQEHYLKKPPSTHAAAKENGTLKRAVTHPLHPPVVKVDPQKAELIKHVVELGLGRGIDATSRTPWTNKSTFQVRRVQPSVVETRELGAVEAYDHTIHSIQQMEHQFQASLNPPESPVSVCVEDENNRTLNTTRRVIGRRVVNSTVGFQTDFEEKCSDGESPKFARDSFLVPRDPTEVVFNTQNSSQTFEERVSQWLLHRIAHRFALAGQKCDFFRAEGSCMDRLAKLIHSKAIPKTEEYVKAGCKELIRGLRITHYVSSMKLGALEYRVISDGEYNKKLAKGGAFGLDAVVESCVKTPKRLSKKEASKCSQLRRLGMISKDDCVERKSSNETVISIEMQPIARLLRLPVIKLAIQDAVDEYMDNTLGTEGMWALLVARPSHGGTGVIVDYAKRQSIPN